MDRLRKMVGLVLALGAVVVLLLSLSVSASAAEVVDSGTCGTNLTWVFDSEGTLTVSGNGDMAVSNYEWPWYSFRNEISTLVIQEGVTSVGGAAFQGCFCLTKVELSKSVNKIEELAFSACEMPSITLPESIESIGDEAFYYCWHLTDIDIPSNLTNISDSAFRMCFGLKSIDVSQNNAVYSSENGVLFNKNQTEMICYPYGRNDESYTVPDTVVRIGNNAFNDDAGGKLKRLSIPNSVTSIGEYCFYNWAPEEIDYYGSKAQWPDCKRTFS